MGLDQHIYNSKKKECCYFRKVNFLRNYMINIGMDEDANCDSFKLSRDDLEDIVGKCKDVLENKNLAEELLPTLSGFFFGDTKYDECYFTNVEDVKCKIEQVLLKHPRMNVFYYSDWW